MTHEKADRPAPDTPPVAEDVEARAESLLTASSAWDGTAYAAYPQGVPEVTIRKITIPECDRRGRPLRTPRSEGRNSARTRRSDARMGACSGLRSPSWWRR